MRKIDELIDQPDIINADDYFDKSETLSDKEKERILSIAMEKVKEEQNDKEHKRSQYPKERWSLLAKVAVFALSVTMCVGGVAVAAEVFDWDQSLVEYLGLNQDTKKELSDAVSNINKTVKQNEIKAEFVQMVADKHNFYMICEVTVPDRIKLTKDNYYFDSIAACYTDFDSGNDMSFSGSFGAELQKIEENILTFVISVSNVDGFREAPMCLRLGGLIGVDDKDMENPEFDLEKYTKEEMIEGEWTLKWDLKFDNISKTYELNKPITLGDKTYTVERVTVSPLSIYAVINGDNIEEDYKVYNDTVGQESEKGTKKQKLSEDFTYNIMIKKIVAIDASEIPLSYAMASTDRDDVHITGVESFEGILSGAILKKSIEIENVKSIYFGDTEYELTEE